MSVYRGITTLIRDALYNDACLLPLLDKELRTSHGSSDFCDQPVTSEAGRPIRRYEQGWPSDFQRAVVAFGQLSSGPLGAENPQEMHIWTFQVGIFVHKSPVKDDGTELAGDELAGEIRDHVIRILALEEADLKTQCQGNGDLRLMLARHAGDILPISFNVDLSVWQATTQFAWTVLGPGVRTPAVGCGPC
jgi:hypothetical protein